MAEKNSALSPMMEKYSATKNNYRDCILMYRLGDFYEMFFDDAIEASKILGITLTGRSCGNGERAPMCGVPYHAVDTYVAKLVNEGKKVAICEQMEDSATAKDLVRRDVVRVITAGTAIENDIIQETKNNYLMSFFADKNTSGIGVCDISTGDFFTTEIATKNMDKIEEFILAFKPSEIICNAFALPFNKSSRLVASRTIPAMTEYYDWTFANYKATETICAQYGVKTLKGFGLEKYSCAVNACGALILYLKETQKRALPHLKPIKIVEDNEYMSIDLSTRRSLELTANTRDNSKYGSLLWLLDKTRTSMGARKLNSWVNRPLQNSKEIKLRLDAVEELTKDYVLRECIFDTLSGIKDLERLVTKVAYKTAVPRDLLAIGETLKRLPTIYDYLNKSKCALLRNTMSNIVVLNDLADEILNAITDKMTDYEKTKTSNDYIKDGYDAKLDEYRNIKRNTTAYLRELTQREILNTGIKNLKLGNNRVFGYYFETTNQYKDIIPPSYIRRQSLANGERFVTEELKVAEEKIINAEDYCDKIQAELYRNLCSKVLEKTHEIQTTANALAVIDALIALSKVAVQNNYVKPRVMPQTANLVIKEGRHPIVEKFLKNEIFIANDIDINTSDKRTMIITGPNMAGKSTYMRQIALIVIMAHIGSFVPAKFAEIPLTDKIFTRVGASDEISMHQSTFMVEMTEVAYILNNATQNSLILLDEVGRGTATFDGLSIAWAVIEYITKNIRAKTLFATHYHELTELEGRLDGVTNFKVAVKEVNGSIVLLHKITKGGTAKSFGIEVAKLAGVPEEVTDRAKFVLKQLEKSDVNKNVFEIEDDMEFVKKQEKMTVKAIKMYNEIRQLNINNCTPLVAFDILSQLITETKEN